MVGTIVAVIVVSASAAFAYFTSTGSGTGSASVGQAGNWKVTVAKSTGKVVPGSGSSTASYTILNQGKGGQAFTTVTATVDADSDGDVLDASNNDAPVAGCSASWFTADPGTTTPGVNNSIPAGGTATGTVTVTMTDEPVNQDACAGFSPEITVTVDAPAPAPTQTS